MRIACIYVPQLALQAALRAAPERRGTPVAVIGKARRRSEAVVAANDKARRGGVRLGMTAEQARALCPEVFVVRESPADVAAAEAALADVGFAFAPCIETESARVFLDVSDMNGWFCSGQRDTSPWAQSDSIARNVKAASSGGSSGSSGSSGTSRVAGNAGRHHIERSIAQAIAAQATRVGLGVRVAIASRKSVARLATRAREIAIVAAGDEGPFLAPLPARILGPDLSIEEAETLERWGIGTLGELAALPAAEVGLRLGPAGSRLVHLARGTDDETFMPRWPQETLEESVAFDYAIVELEPLAFVLRGLVDRVLARLDLRALACAGLTLRLKLESGAFDVRSVPVAAPTREPTTLLQLLRLDVARRPPEAGVVEVLLGADPARARAAQLDFLRPAGPAPDRLAATIARLAALVGPENLGSPRTEDTWREEAMSVTAYRHKPANTVGVPSTVTNEATPFSSPTLAIRRFRPAEEVEVMIGPDGPAALRGRDTTARILVAAGPYRMSGEWWRSQQAETADASFSRDYWDVHASDGALYRLHQDRRTGRWFLDGYYD